MLFCAFDAYMETKFVAVMRVNFTRNVIGSVANQNGPSTFLRLYVVGAMVDTYPKEESICRGDI